MEITCCWMYAIGSYGFPPTLPQMIQAIGEMASMGFDYIELEGVGVDYLSEQAKMADTIAHACTDAGVRVSNFAAVLPDLVSTDKVTQSRAFDAFEEAADIAAVLESPFMWTDSYAPPVEFTEGTRLSDQIIFGENYSIRVPDGFSWPAHWDRLVNAMAKCTAIAKDRGLTMLLEPRVGEVVSTSDALIRLGERINDKHFGVILDTAHMHAQKELLPVSVHKLSGLIRYVHVADNDGRENHHFPIGQGNIDWPELLRNLRAVGFDGFYAIDLEKVDDLKQAFVQSKEALFRLFATQGDA